MGKIVAIGGGEIHLEETLTIDKFIVEFSESKNPKLLFIPTASNDSEGYIKTIEYIYGDMLGCTVDTLLLTKEKIDEKEIKTKILSSDIIYVGGGDTVTMMKIWREKNVIKYLKEAYNKNIVLSGLSAGSICWFEKGHSDSNSFSNPNGTWDYTQAIGTGFIHAIHCPHYNEPGRESFDKMMITESLPGIAIENNCAIVIKDNMYKIINSDNKGKAYLLKNENGIVSKTELSITDYAPLSNIL